ncbi:hypothetical protein [Bradyrhizobium sp. ORS 86]|uniref:hypothetical protein n=1 Tax=Bradyrhizobium sp. ORS 86 TaxID=1685970 RepID=UPI00388DCF8E
MTRPISLFRFLDGPLMDQATRREEVIRRMAKDLAEHNAFSCERDAIRVLMTAGYPSYDVMALVGEARQVAQQELVAAQMSRVP